MVKKIVFGVLLVIVGLVIWKWKDVKEFILKSERTINGTEVKLLLAKDPTFSELNQILIEKGIIEKPDVLRNHVLKNGVDTNNLEGGKYIIKGGTRIADLMNGFQRASNGQGVDEIPVKVVFNSCRDINDIGQNIAKCIAADSASIVDYILDPKTLQKYGFTKEQVPALFLPDEYQMYYDTDAEEFVAIMAEKFKEFWNESRKEKMSAIGLSSPSQVVTLASIVRAEQGKVPEEWPVIAALYLNRLKQGIRLQSDPTFKFCWGDQLDGVQRLRAKHRAIDCSYNTYKIDGLPPGPIGLTSGKVIDAVLEPAEVDYLFMCAKPDYSGEHNFTSSGSQHEKNARVYQQWLAKELEN